MPVNTSADVIPAALSAGTARFRPLGNFQRSAQGDYSEHDLHSQSAQIRLGSWLASGSHLKILAARLRLHS